MSKPRIGVSACLLGRKVRYNGDSKRSDWLVDQLGKFVTWVPVCPEVEMGLGVPRKPMRLVGTPSRPDLMVIETKEILTELAERTAQRILSKDLDLDSYILKKDSPSCGLERVKVYRPSGIPEKRGVGVFADALKVFDPLLPVIEEGRLMDAKQRESFVIQIFSWHQLKKLEVKVSILQKFHEANKLLLMSLNPMLYRLLGKIAANSERNKESIVFAEYRKFFSEAIRSPLTLSNRVNALQHMIGYFRKILDLKERQQLIEVVEEYQRGEIPLIVPLTLFNHLARRHSVDYLLNQTFFHPFPKGLKL